MKETKFTLNGWSFQLSSHTGYSSLSTYYFLISVKITEQAHSSRSFLVTIGHASSTPRLRDSKPGLEQGTFTTSSANCYASKINWNGINR